MILGYTSTSAAMLDLDDVTLTRTKSIAQRLIGRFHLEGFLVVRSSVKHYHVIFNRPLTWRMVLRVIFAVDVCRKRYHNHFSWAEMQAIKGAATIRLGPKGRKKSPRPVFRAGLQDKEIKSYLTLRKSLHV